MNRNIRLESVLDQINEIIKEKKEQKKIQQESTEIKTLKKLISTYDNYSDHDVNSSYGLFHSKKMFKLMLVIFQMQENKIQHLEEKIIKLSLDN